MGLASRQPSAGSPHSKLVNDLSSLTETLPAAAFIPSIINYLLFPITTIIRSSNPQQLPDDFLEAVFRFLALVARNWHDIDLQAWEQLWKFTTMAVAPRVLGKGKTKELDQEVLVRAIELFGALLVQSPSEEMLKRVERDAPLLSTLFQTISIAIEAANPAVPHVKLQSEAIRLLRRIVQRYLNGKHEMLASVLPGLVSSMSKILHQGKVKGEIVEESIGLINDVVVETINDKNLRRLGVIRPVMEDLDQLGQWTEGTDPPEKNSKATPFPPLSSSYLAFTSQQLSNALPPLLSTLASHPSHLARTAIADLAYSLIHHCSSALPLLVRPSLTTLLVLSRDDFAPVQSYASSKLSLLPELDRIVLDLLSDSINALPRLIVSQQDTKVDHLAKLITAICSIPNTALGDLLGPRGSVERWGWSLLNCLEFGRSRGWSKSDLAIGWDQSFSVDHLEEIFPLIPFRYVESESTANALSRMLVALGRASGEGALHSVEYFLLFARSNKGSQVEKAVSAIWVAERLLAGISAGKEGKMGKRIRKMAKEVVRVVVSLDEEDDGEEGEESPPTQDALVPVERSKGINGLTTLLDKNVKNANTTQTRRLHIQAQRNLLTAFSMSLLSLSAKILSFSFRPLLLTALYTVLSNLASSQYLVRQYAHVALGKIAFHIGYASPRNMILDNVDYVVNVVSQRLTYSRLSSQAPLVLISMIKLVGNEIVPLVHDVVDEIFDALDDYHGYELLCSTLLAVLSTLIDVMSDEVESVENVATPEETIEKPPDAEKDFALFVKWYKERKALNEKVMEEILERAPQQAWGTIPEAEPEHAPEDEEVPPTRSQQVCIQILGKSIYFLSHQSPFLRSKILSLVSKATIVLASGDRQAELLPLIDKAWPLILNRLSDDYPYVVTEAAQVIACLSENVGDFMGKRILDHAWPKMKILVEKQRGLDDKSALGLKGKGMGTEMQYSVSNRLYTAVIEMAGFVVGQVPVVDQVIWEMILLFIPFLEEGTNDELVEKAVHLYGRLKERDEDAVWTGLGMEGAWGHLREERSNVGKNVANILGSGGKA
ncbi:TELO2-interacting protein 1, partial [Tremellales sp. Uapishka_1]